MTEKRLNVRVLALNKILYDGQAAAVLLPGTVGAFEVLPGHAPIISSLERGKIVIRDNDTEATELAVDGGVVMIKENVVTVCAD